MSIVKGPLFSLDADGTIGKSLSYSKKSQNNIVSKYSKPGDVSPGESSPRQKDQRSIIRLITIHWQCMDDLNRLAWETAAKAARFKGSGYHYFLHLAQTDLLTYLGLIGYWSMNYETSGILPDLSGNGNHGTLGPVYPCDSPTLVDSVNKKEGKAASLNGSTNYISCGSIPSLKVTSTLTIESLIYLESIIGNPNIISKRASGLREPFRLELRTYGVYLVASETGLDHTNAGFSYIIPLNTFIHLLITYNSGNFSLYVNGILFNTVNIVMPSLFATNENLFIGSRNTVENFFLGKLDNILIYNVVLEPNEILAHAKSYNLP